MCLGAFGRQGGREGLVRLRGMALQRVWTERANHPIYSRYAQSLVELVCSIKLAETSASLPSSSSTASSSSPLASDPSFPLELPPLESDALVDVEQQQQQQPRCREWDEGVVASDEGWEVWSGSVTQPAAIWKKPSRRGGAGGGGREMEGGEGPPLLVPGRKVIRGPDWVEASREGGKKGGKEEEVVVKQEEAQGAGEEEGGAKKKKVSLAFSLPASDRKNLMVGVVVEIVDWVEEVEVGKEEGLRLKGKARRVKWADGEEGIYRWGANGCFDLTQVEVGRDGKSILKRYAFPDTSEVIAARHGFGEEWRCGVVLWIRPTPPSAGSISSSRRFEGVCEWPDQGAATWVSGEKKDDGSIFFREEKLLMGSDMVWTRRFGAPQWRAGLCYSLKLLPPEEEEGGGERWGGECLFGSSVRLGGEVVRLREVWKLQKRDLFSLDRYAKAGSIAVSEDGRSVSCSSSESKALVYGSVGFARGVHYWEVKIEQEEVGSIFLGVAEKPTDTGAAMRAAVHRWHGYGFINYRASFAWTPAEAAVAAAASAGGAGALIGVSPERPYGENFQAGDIVGMKLDMDRGVLSFFLDGMKYGEHILADLGVAHEGLLGGGQGGERVRPRVLFPVIGFRKKGDRVTLTGRWFSSPGIHPRVVLEDVQAVVCLMHAWEQQQQQQQQHQHHQPARTAAVPGMAMGTESWQQQQQQQQRQQEDHIPLWAYREAWSDWRRWRQGRWRRILTRAQSSAWVDVDTSIDACLRASLLLGMRQPLLAGDRVRMTRRCGKVLEQPEGRVVLGAYRGLLWYETLDSPREGNAGGGAGEGGGKHGVLVLAAV